MPLTCGIAGFLGAPGGRTFYREKVPAPPGRIPVPGTAVSDVKILVSFQAGTYRYRSGGNVSVSFRQERVSVVSAGMCRYNKKRRPRYPFDTKNSAS